MKIIVAGGTGFLGKKIVSSLADKGHNVCVLTRNLHKHKNTFSNNVNVIDWSTINPSFLSDTNILIKLNGEKVDQLWTKSVKSKILNSREQLYESIESFKKKFPNNRKVPRPPYRAGWNLKPNKIEFWLDGESRVHERLLYELTISQVTVYHPKLHKVRYL